MIMIFNDNVMFIECMNKHTLIARFIRTNIWSIRRLKLAISFLPSNVGSITSFGAARCKIDLIIKNIKTISDLLLFITAKSIYYINLPGFNCGIENVPVVLIISMRDIILMKTRRFE